MDDTNTNSDGAITPKKLTLVKFSADWCGYCRGMDRARTVEKFLAAHPDVTLVSHHNIVEGDAADLAMEEYGVTGLPAFVWEDAEGNPVYRDGGATSLAGMEKMHAKALAMAERDTYGEDKRPKRRKGSR